MGTIDKDALSLAGAIENVTDVNERRALSLVHHLAPVLREWRAAEDLRAKIAKNETESTAQRQAFERLKPEVESARAARDAALALNEKFKMAAGVVVAAALLGFFFVGFIVALLVAGAGGGAVFYFHKQHQEKLAGLESALIDVERQLAAANSALERLTAETTELIAELGKRSKGFPEVRIAEVNFPLAGTKIGDRNLLVDLSAAHQPISLHTVDVSALESGVRHIADRAQQLLQVPPMLAPADGSGELREDPDAEETLHGEEEELQRLVTDFTLNLGKLRDSRLELPLVGTDSPLVRRLRERLSGPSATPTGITVSDSPDTVDQIRSFVDSANATRDRANTVFAELNEVFQRLERACNLYAVARTTSMNAIHENLLEVLNRANWCNRRFYCPRTILSPAYVQELVGIDLDSGHLVQIDELIERLMADPVVQRRLESQPALVTELRDAHDAVHEFLHGIGDTNGDELEPGALPTHIASQLRESQRHLRNVLQKIMTGSTYPVLNFSAEAQLFYDPVSGHWSSPTTPHTYSTPDVMRFGSMVKAYTDVMMPLWEHLWTEKADFRKSEVFRTNESMIRMTEKESEKLIEIANQFRADMRTVREHVFTLESDLRSKFQEIVGFRDGMSQLGLISDKAMDTLSDARLAEVSVVEFDRGSMDRMETLLGAMPQAQAELRGSVHDPIDAIREPSALLSTKAAANRRLVENEV